MNLRSDRPEAETDPIKILQQKKIWMTCGLGGVGKTSLSAALAFQLAESGKKVLVVTIDPAKRLATAMGLDGHLEAPFLIRKNQGETWGFMPRLQESFFRMIRGMNLPPEKMERILANPFLQLFQTEFSGANEYLALEELLYHYETQKYDHILLDTPPAQHTRDFLESPHQLISFFEEKWMRWLVSPGSDLLAGAFKKVLQVLEKITGSGFIRQLVDFAALCMELREYFLKRIHQSAALLRSDEFGVILVAAPQKKSLEDADLFFEYLAKIHKRASLVFINRTVVTLEKVTLDRVPLEKSGLEFIDEIQELEKSSLQAAKKKMKEWETPVFLAPEMAKDISSVEDLLKMGTKFKKYVLGIFIFFGIFHLSLEIQAASPTARQYLDAGKWSEALLSLKSNPQQVSSSEAETLRMEAYLRLNLLSESRQSWISLLNSSGLPTKKARRIGIELETKECVEEFKKSENLLDPNHREEQDLNFYQIYFSCLHKVQSIAKRMKISIARESSLETIWKDAEKIIEEGEKKPGYGKKIQLLHHDYNQEVGKLK